MMNRCRAPLMILHRHGRRFASLFLGSGAFKAAFTTTTTSSKVHCTINLADATNNLTDFSGYLLSGHPAEYVSLTFVVVELPLTLLARRDRFEQDGKFIVSHG